MLRAAHIPFSYSFGDYSQFYTYSELQAVEQLADRLRGKRIVHVNATDSGGGVAEILQNIVPFEQSLNISSSWRVLTVGKPFFSVTKKIHNALQGGVDTFGRDGISDGEWQLYLDQSRDIAQTIESLQAHVLLIHDPQPLFAGTMARIAAHKLARIHIDMSSPDEYMLKRFLPCMQAYERMVFSLSAYIPGGVSEERARIIFPSINPLSEKNVRMKRHTARQKLAKFGVDEDTPLIAQVSRFDPWKDPIGVIQAYHMAREKIPALRLILMGSTQVADDPEAAGILKEILAYTEKDASISIISEHSDELVNAVQTAADVIVQKSLREGFGLTVTEAMWKSRPVIAGNVGGIRRQIKNGENGYLVNSVEEAAARIVELMNNEELRSAMGMRAHDTVRERFLLPREAYNHLQLYADVLGIA